MGDDDGGGASVFSGGPVSKKKENELNVTLINTNVRSICPKINSLVECLDKVDAIFGIVTETWLSDDRELQDKLDDLSCGAGLGLITKNRPMNLSLIHI